ncbi:MAG: zf-HC2 domain-containing protein [Brevundimonas sp.]|nr:zf-HC2 domain-containing protein [Brevundimonas sp.]
MFDCQEVSRRLSEAQDRPLPTADRARMRLHLMMCRSCRNVEEQFDFIRRAMRRLGEDEGEGEIPRR